MAYRGKVTVLIPAFYHRSNLARCLEAWRRQTLHPDQLIIINDAGNGDVDLLPGEDLLDLNRGETRIWRTTNMAVRAAWPLIQHDYIVLCSCDLIFPSFALEVMLDTQKDDCRCSATVYGLSRAMTARLDAVDWEGSECLVFHSEPGFSGWANTFKSTNAESPAWKAHILFNGNTRRGWERFNSLAFPEDEEVGGDECWLRQVEVDAGRPIITLPYAVYHQWHPIRQRLTDYYDPSAELPYGAEQDFSEPMSVRARRIAMKGMRENCNDQ